jgi:hypothetical protein
MLYYFHTFIRALRQISEFCEATYNYFCEFFHIRMLVCICCHCQGCHITTKRRKYTQTVYPVLRARLQPGALNAEARALVWQRLAMLQYDDRLRTLEEVSCCASRCTVCNLDRTVCANPTGSYTKDHGSGLQGRRQVCVCSTRYAVCCLPLLRPARPVLLLC